MGSSRARVASLPSIYSRPLLMGQIGRCAIGRTNRLCQYFGDKYERHGAVLTNPLQCRTILSCSLSRGHHGQEKPGKHTLEGDPQRLERCRADWDTRGKCRARLGPCSGAPGAGPRRTLGEQDQDIAAGPRPGLTNGFQRLTATVLPGLINWRLL